MKDPSGLDGKAWKGQAALGTMLPGHHGGQRVSGSDLLWKALTTVWKVGWRESRWDTGVPARKMLFWDKLQVIKAR